MYKLRVKRSFCAGHYLPGYDGDCAHQHGHTWTVEVTVSAKSVGNGGMVVDFKDVKRATDKIIEQFDHSNLNDLPWFSVCPPTAENVAMVIYDYLKDKFKEPACLHSVTVWESDSASVEFSR